MTKRVELRRHTDNDGDYLTPDGVRAALEVGTRLEGPYDLMVSSGAQRATQTLACFLAATGMRTDAGVVVDERFRSEDEDRWKRTYKEAGAGDLESFRRVDPELVETESRRFGEALRDTFARLPDGGRALVVGHSPMNEAAVYGLTGEAIEPLSKGAGVLVTASDNGGYEVTPLN
ncbi:MAG: histidine phosphatase family protein [Actinomycetota bacterium]